MEDGDTRKIKVEVNWGGKGQLVTNMNRRGGPQRY